MIKFKNWIENNIGTDNVDSQIDNLYDKAKYAIKIVQLYIKSMPSQEKDLLKGISTIAPLNSSVYGLYNSGENKAIIGQPMANQTRFKFGVDTLANQDDIQKLPISVIRRYFPDVPDNQIKPSDIIHVNVQKIVSELGDSKEAIIQIASTIIHEATHEREYRLTGKTSEVGPQKAEQVFNSWVAKNWNRILSSIPELKNLNFSR